MKLRSGEHTGTRKFVKDYKRTRRRHREVVAGCTAPANMSPLCSRQDPSASFQQPTTPATSRSSFVLLDHDVYTFDDDSAIESEDEELRELLSVQNFHELIESSGGEFRTSTPVPVAPASDDSGKAVVDDHDGLIGILFGMYSMAACLFKILTSFE